MTETKDVITEAITRSRDNAIEAVISVVTSYRELQFNPNARKTLDDLLIQLNRFADGVKAGRNE